MTWLILAIKNGRSDAAKFLMSQRVDINKVDNDGNTAIHHAFMLNFESCIQLLIDSGAEENLKNGEGYQPWELHDAMRGDDWEWIYHYYTPLTDWKRELWFNLIVEFLLL